ncbi:MAG: LytTR family DNA-binding domain-containing protein [bacterium]|nr:LytTR family DNA-binding domain-containing protein [bacterium]
MKITIEDKPVDCEDEIIIRCDAVDESLMQLINSLKRGKNKLNVYLDGAIHLVDPEEIYYFETVDQRVFAYAKEAVYETKCRLYELEEQLPKQDFFRASKSTILNLDKIKSLSPAFGGRFEVKLTNGERLLISRQYVSALKEKLGIIQS